MVVSTYSKEYLLEPDFYFDDANGLFANMSIIKKFPADTQVVHPCACVLQLEVRICPMRYGARVYASDEFSHLLQLCYSLFTSVHIFGIFLVIILMSTRKEFLFNRYRGIEPPFYLLPFFK